MDRQRCVTVCNLLRLPCTFLSPYSLYQVPSLRIPRDIQDLISRSRAPNLKSLLLTKEPKQKKKKKKKNGGKKWRSTKVYVLLYYKKLSALAVRLTLAFSEEVSRNQLRPFSLPWDLDNYY